MEARTCLKIGQSTITETFSDEGKTHVKILWSIKHVLSRYSDNSVKDAVNLFQKMFPDPNVPLKMELGPGKVRYVVNHSIAQYFKTIVKYEILFI